MNLIEKNPEIALAALMAALMAAMGLLEDDPAQEAAVRDCMETVPMEARVDLVKRLEGRVAIEYQEQTGKVRRIICKF